MQKTTHTNKLRCNFCREFEDPSDLVKICLENHFYHSACVHPQFGCSICRRNHNSKNKNGNGNKNGNKNNKNRNKNNQSNKKNCNQNYGNNKNQGSRVITVQQDQGVTMDTYPELKKLMIQAGYLPNTTNTSNEIATIPRNGYSVQYRKRIIEECFSFRC